MKKTRPIRKKTYKVEGYFCETRKTRVLYYKRRGQGRGNGSDPLDHEPAARIDCGRGWRRLTGTPRLTRPRIDLGRPIGIQRPLC
jgi:hypothetical protein